jgi:Pyridoxamine 5'-phosphate oxidase
MATGSVTSARVAAAAAYVRALRTGEASAAARASGQLAEDVALTVGDRRVEGRSAVLERITGQWPLTPVLLQGAWSDPSEGGEAVTVRASFTGIGAAPAEVTLRFEFDPEDRIREVRQEVRPGPPPQVSDAIPDHVRALVNCALASGLPMAVAYVDGDGQPVLSPRGSTQVYGPAQLTIWVRNAEGGLASAVAANPRLALLYRDSRTRTTLIFQGRGSVVSDQAVRDRVFELAPEVEQNHDPDRRGAALLIEVERLQGTTAQGPVRMERHLDG